MDIKTAQTLHTNLTSWLAHHSLLLNASIAFNVDFQAWVYHFDNPLTCMPEDRMIGESVDELDIRKKIQIIEINHIHDVRNSLATEIDGPEDLTSSQKAGLNFIGIDYEKVLSC